MSHNGWLYASANPAEPDGLFRHVLDRPQCEAVLDLQAREISEPMGLSRPGNPERKSPHTPTGVRHPLDISVAPGITTTTASAQFHVPGYLVSEVPGITECNILRIRIELCQRNTGCCGRKSVLPRCSPSMPRRLSAFGTSCAVRAALGSGRMGRRDRTSACWLRERVRTAIDSKRPRHRVRRPRASAGSGTPSTGTQFSNAPCQHRLWQLQTQ